MRRQTNIRQTRSDRIFGAVDTLLLAVVFLIIAYPLYFVVIASFSDPQMVSSG